MSALIGLGLERLEYDFALIKFVDVPTVHVISGIKSLFFQ